MAEDPIPSAEPEISAPPPVEPPRPARPDPGVIDGEAIEIGYDAKGNRCKDEGEAGEAASFGRAGRRASRRPSPGRC